MYLKIPIDQKHGLSFIAYSLFERTALFTHCLGMFLCRSSTLPVASVWQVLTKSSTSLNLEMGEVYCYFFVFLIHFLGAGLLLHVFVPTPLTIHLSYRVEEGFDRNSINWPDFVKGEWNYEDLTGAHGQKFGA